MSGEGIWDHRQYDEAANYLKLIYPEGEIDFIVASYIADVPTERKAVGLSELGTGLSYTIEIEHPVEIALKKLNYRGTLLKVRDIFYIAVMDRLFPDLLQDNLHFVPHLKAAIWQKADICLDRMREIAEAIPERKCTP